MTTGGKEERMRDRGKPPDHYRRRPLLLLLLLGLLLLAMAGAFATPPSPPPSSSSSSSSGKRKRRGRGPGKGPKGGGGKEQQQQQQQQSPRMKPRLMPATQANDAREAAYLAALAAERDQGFISDALQQWAVAKKPSGSEMGLATLVASVACREAASLDYAITQLANGSEGPRVRLKGRQRVVLRVALAQYKHCTKTPVYAIVDHAVGLAKRYGGGPPFASFVNALLRKLPPDDKDEDKEGRGTTTGAGAGAHTRPLPLPEGDSVEALSAALSFPPFLVSLLIEDYGLPAARRIMEASNTFPPTMARGRGRNAAVPSLEEEQQQVDDADAVTATPISNEDGAGLLLGPEEPPAAAVPPSPPPPPPAQLFEPVAPTDLPPALARAGRHGHGPMLLPYPLGVVRSKELLRRLTADPRWYVTNGTPAGLIARLAEGAVARILGGDGDGDGVSVPLPPLRVLDVCAAPGGKGLAVWDVVKEGQGHPVRLVMNDVSEEKTRRIRENLGKFGLLPSPTEAEEDNADDAAAAVRISVGDGTALSLDDNGDDDHPGYDVVIVDAPCSNAGVLGRRPEARWRLGDGALLGELEGTQLALLRNARELLSRKHEGAEVWYMTCSILKREDEGLVARACRELGLEVVDEALEMKVLPGEGGLGSAFDGGYGVALRRKRERTA